jgi:hypothetical protein
MPKKYATEAERKAAQKASAHRSYMKRKAEGKIKPLTAKQKAYRNAEAKKKREECKEATAFQKGYNARKQNKKIANYIKE